MSEINSFNDYAIRYNTNMDYSTLFGGGAPYIDSGMGGGNVSDYVMIKNGSYGKLMKAYFAKQDADKLSQTGDSSKTLTLMRSSADSLKKSAEALIRLITRTALIPTQSRSCSKARLMKEWAAKTRIKIR